MHFNSTKTELAIVKRANSIETIHLGSYALFDDNKFLCSGESFLESYVCLRSTAKPFQTLTCLKLGLSLEDKEVAICTGSHSGTTEHTNFVDELLNKYKISWTNLNCGEHQPISPETNYADKNTKLRKLQNNCSAKHLMMIATCKFNNLDIDSYTDNKHPLQREVLKTLSELCEININSIHTALDGCGLPTYALPVKNLLTGFSKFNINSQDRNIQKIVKSMLQYPFYVSGENRLDYEISETMKGQAICKSGAGGISIVSFQGNLPKALILKMFDTNEQIRANILKKLIEGIGYKEDFSNKLFSEEITNLHGHAAASIHINTPLSLN